MRAIAIVLLVTMAGCSWITARANNNPRVGCSRTTGRIDLILSLASVVATVAVVAEYRIDAPLDDHGQGDVASLKASVLVGVGIIEALQAWYGLGVANRCEAERAKLTARPLSGPPSMTP